MSVQKTRALPHATAACENKTLIRSQIGADGVKRQCFEGIDSANYQSVGFWFNTKTSTVETAFPLGSVK